METLSVNEVTMPPRTTPNFTKSDGVSLRDHLEDKIATKEEFVAQYAARSSMTIADLESGGMNAYVCNCGDPSCEGWRMSTQGPHGPFCACPPGGTYVGLGCPNPAYKLYVGEP